MSAEIDPEIERLLRVQKGLLYLGRGLRPFVAEHMSAKYGENWFYSEFVYRANDSDRQNPLDTYELLRTMNDEWDKTFVKCFKRRQMFSTRRFTRAALCIAEEARHALAHEFPGLIQDGEVDVYLYSMYKLLENVEADYDLVESLKAVWEEQQRSAGSNVTPSTIIDTNVQATRDNDLCVTRIKDPDCDDLLEMWYLHKNEFPDDDIADSYDSFKRWVSETDINDQILPKDHELDDIMLALKSTNQVVGYLYAQHYINRKLVFISYIATDRTLPGIRCRGARKLIGKLVELCDSRSSAWHAILGEVEQVKSASKHRDMELFRVFETHAKQLATLSITASRLFMINFDYNQPVIRPEDLNRERTSVEGLKQKLLYFARDVASLDKDAEGHYVLPSSDAINIFDTLLCCVYADAYPNHIAYQQYLQAEMELHRPQLQQGLPLIDLALPGAAAPGADKSR